jgi:hypothetical protein
MSLNGNAGKFDLYPQDGSREVFFASWAVVLFGDGLWAELRRELNQASRCYAGADMNARGCWDERFRKSQNPLSYATACECVELILS